MNYNMARRTNYGIVYYERRLRERLARKQLTYKTEKGQNRCLDRIHRSMARELAHKLATS